MGGLNRVEGGVEDIGDGDPPPTNDAAVFVPLLALHALISIDDPTRRPNPDRFITRITPRRAAGFGSADQQHR
jgi:hypothetical protein